MLMKEKLCTEKSEFSMFVYIVVFLTNIGQTPTLIDNFQTRIMIIPLWLIFAAICILKNHILYLGKSKFVWILAGWWTIIYLVGSLFINGYSNSDLPYTIYLSLFILLTGLMAGNSLKNNDMERIFTAYVLSGMIVCVDTFLTYVYGRSFAGRVYSYDSKNSVSQILLTVWVVILICKFRMGLETRKKILYAGEFLLLTVTLIGLKSRASLIAIPVVLMWLILHGKMNKQLRNTIFAILLFVLFFLIFNPRYMEILIYDVLLGGRDISNLNDISSGRASEWQTFFSDFINKPFLGHGRMKRESLILTSLLEFGLLGGGAILIIACWPLYWAIRYFRKKNSDYLIFSSIAIVYLINGIFEQLAPFGPGVKCYFLWFLLGIYISRVSNNSDIRRKNYG